MCSYCSTVSKTLYISPPQGQPVGECDFSRRLLCIRKEIEETRDSQAQAGTLDKSREPFSVRHKPFWDITMSPKVRS